MKEYLIIGGGHQGLAMASHLAANGEFVNLWNRTKNNINEIIESKRIKCKGVIKKNIYINNASDNIDEVYRDIIFVTVPTNSYEDIAKLLSSKVKNETIIILSPGRTFGSIQFLNYLKKYGCKYTPKIAEMQTIIYTCRKSNANSVEIYKFKKNVMISSLNDKDLEIIKANIPNCINKYLKYVSSIIHTSLNNYGMLLHCAPTLMNVGWIENKKSFKYYYDGISPTIAKYITKMDEERITIGRELGYKLVSLNEWLKENYDTNSNDLYTNLQNDTYKNIDAPITIQHRYLYEDIPCGLVPIEKIAKELKIATPYISKIIDIGSLLCDIDFRKIGRNISIEELKEYIKK